MFFEHENRGEVLKRTDLLTDREYRDFYEASLGRVLSDDRASAIKSKIDPFDTVTILNEIVFCSSNIDKFKGVLNENPECEGSGGDNWV